MISKIEVEAGSNAGYALIRDQLGNWQVKKMRNDPTELINAVFGSTIAAAEFIRSTSSSGVSTAVDDALARMLEGEEDLRTHSRQILDDLEAYRRSVIDTAAQEKKKGLLEDYVRTLKAIEEAITTSIIADSSTGS